MAGYAFSPMAAPEAPVSTYAASEATENATLKFYTPDAPEPQPN
ncbi:MAG: hypothetical protein ACJAYF_001901 [Arenicella sp.]|jgi:hypothetical protein